MPKKVRLTRMIGRMGDVVYDLNHLPFSGFQSIQIFQGRTNFSREGQFVVLWDRFCLQQIQGGQQMKANQESVDLPESAGKFKPY
jgi:flagellar basal body rod protein FlgG